MAAESFLDTFLKYGLFVGGIFQMICIFAIIILPSRQLNEPCIENDSSLTTTTTKSISNKDKAKHKNTKKRR